VGNTVGLIPFHHLQKNLHCIAPWNGAFFFDNEKRISLEARKGKIKRSENVKGAKLLSLGANRLKLTGTYFVRTLRGLSQLVFQHLYSAGSLLLQFFHDTSHHLRLFGQIVNPSLLDFQFEL
jgi:flagellar biosynthesis protein FlhB